MNKVNSKIKKPFLILQEQIRKNPLKSLIITLTVIILTLSGINSLQPTTPTTQPTKEPIEVTTFTIGQTPIIQTQALIKKNNIITLQAQTSGIVQKIHNAEGEKIKQGSKIITITTNYAGETIATAQRQLAQKNLEFAQNNYEKNITIIQDQKNIALQTRENTEKLRQLSEKSAQEINDIINLNNELLKEIQRQINELQQSTNQTPEQEKTLNQLKSQQAQLVGNINQLKATVRSTEYQTNKDNPPTQIAETQKELTIKQLDLQEKSLKLQLEIAKLNYKITEITESLYAPSAPYHGTIQKIHVTEGQTINQGQILATLLTDNTSAIAEITVPHKIANIISRTQPGSLKINNAIIPVTPLHIPAEPTDGSLTTIKYLIPAEKTKHVTHNTYVALEITIGEPNTKKPLPFIPVDALFQTQNETYVYIAEEKEGKTIAKTKKIIPGEIVGKYIFIQAGINKEDKIILNRNVLEGDVIKIKHDTIIASKTL